MGVIVYCILGFIYQYLGCIRVINITLYEKRLSHTLLFFSHTSSPTSSLSPSPLPLICRD